MSSDKSLAPSPDSLLHKREKQCGFKESASGFGVKNPELGLPWWCSGWESACQCRGHGFEPWSGKIPHAAEQLGP